MRKLIATVAAGGAAALIIALAGNPGAVETIANASSVHSSAAMMKKSKKTKKSKKCKKGYKKNKKGKCVKKSTPGTTTTTGANTTTTGTNTTTTSTGTTTTSTGTTGTTTTGTAKPTMAEVEAGKTLFDATCSSCHGMKGEGVSGIAPAYGAELPRSESIKGVVEQLEKPINEKPVKMPEYGSKYSLAEKEELGAYVAVELTKKEKIGGGG